MLQREEEILDIIFDRIDPIPNLHILADNIKKRMGVISFYIDDLHFNLGVKILNDRYGIQMRGGCSCAGTYGHILLHIPQLVSNEITNEIDHGNFTSKPGWIRFSIHPTMTNDEVYYITAALKELSENHKEWAKDYTYNGNSNEFIHQQGDVNIHTKVDRIFDAI